MVVMSDLFSGVEIGLQSPQYSVDEDGGQVSICAELNAGSLERNVTLLFSTVDGTATSNGTILSYFVQSFT